MKPFLQVTYVLINSSLPSWERGLKPYSAHPKAFSGSPSLPSWERGLKQELPQRSESPDLSLPSWERGLKRQRFCILHQRHKVAPFVGAWIETSPLKQRQLISVSLPSWERGLKQPYISCLRVSVRRSLRGSVD